MREVITIQILRPNFDDMPDDVKKQWIDKMAKDITHQIVTQETLRHMNEDIQYWQNIFLKWEVEDHLRRLNG